MAASKEKPEVVGVEKAHASVGLIGVEVDKTPNSHYSVAGVTAKKPTPETEA